MDAGWPISSKAAGDDNDAYDDWASALANTPGSNMPGIEDTAPAPRVESSEPGATDLGAATNKILTATLQSNSNDTVSEMKNILASEMPTASNLDHVFGHIPYTARTSPPTTPSLDTFGLLTQEPHSQVDNTPISPAPEASSPHDQLEPVLGLSHAPEDGQVESSANGGLLSWADTEGPASGTAQVNQEEEQVDIKQDSKDELDEMVKNAAQKTEAPQQQSDVQFENNPADDSLGQFNATADLDWMRTETIDGAHGHQKAPSSHEVLVAEEPSAQSGIEESITDGPHPNSFVEDAAGEPLSGVENHALAINQSAPTNAESGAEQQDTSRPNVEVQPVEPITFVTADPESQWDNVMAAAGPGDAYQHQGRAAVSFADLPETSSVPDSAWLVGEDEVTQPNTERDTNELPREGDQPESEAKADTDWLGGEKAEATVEDSWAQAFGAPEKLDDTWGAAFADDEEGFLDDGPGMADDSIAAVNPASVVPAALPPYAPSSVTNVSSIPPSTAPQNVFTPAATPLTSSYTATAAVRPQAAERAVTATPMQFFEDLPSTRPLPARRPKQQAVAMAPPSGPIPPVGATPTIPGRPIPPPRTSSAAISQYGGLQGPDRLDPFPPRPVPLAAPSISQPYGGPSQSAPPVNTRYSPAPNQPPIAAAVSKPPTPGTSRYVSAQHPAAPLQRAPSSYAPVTTPVLAPAIVPTQPYAPTTPPVTQQGFSVAGLSPPKPPPGTSRYSPTAPSAGGIATTPAAQPHAALPARTVPPPAASHRFIPRTSSPLAAPNQRPQNEKMPSSGFPPSAPHSQPLPAASMPPPPVPSQRYGPSLGATRPPGAPRLGDRSVSYAPQPISKPPLQDPVVFEPPPRPRTSSPIQVRNRAQGVDPVLDKPASVNTVTSPIAAQVSYGPSTMERATEEFVLPNDETQTDPLERWRGAPIFRWGAGGTMISSIPKHIPRYGGGQSAPKIKPVAGEIKLRKVKDLIVEGDGLSTFPGPLRSKGKKKDVLSWLSTRIAALEHLVGSDSGAGRNAEEKVVLWKAVRLMVEHDGVLSGNSAVTNAMKELLSTIPASSKQATHAASAEVSSVQEPQVQDPAVLDEIRRLLMEGDREKAVWHAVDNRLWAHALIVSSTTDGKLWKQVVQEYVRKQLRNTTQDNRSLAALYEVFAGNWDESVDQLVPLAARQGFQMVSAADAPGQKRDGLEGLEKWRETLSLVITNRSNGDENALLALGKLLISCGRIEAAHLCYLFARNVTNFGGADDVSAQFTLLGVDLSSDKSPRIPDTDSILLTEVYEFALSLPPASSAFFPPHLQAYKLKHAYLLAEQGLRNEALQYCEAITAALKSSTRGSPYYHPLLVGQVDDLSRRLTQTAKDTSSGWISKLSADKVSGSMWSKFNKFVVGEEADGEAAGAAHTTEEVGPFGRVSGGTPTISRSPSVADMYGADIARAPSGMGGGRYAPSAYGSSPDLSRGNMQNSYAPIYGSSPEAATKPYERRISQDMPTAFGSPPRIPGFQRQPSGLSRYKSNENTSAPYEPRNAQPPSSYEPYVPAVPEGIALDYSNYPASRRTSTMAAQPGSPHFTSPPVSQPASNRESVSSAIPDQQNSSSYEPSFLSSEPSFGYPSASPAPHTSSYAPSAYEPSTPQENEPESSEQAPLTKEVVQSASEIPSTTNDYEPSPYSYQPVAQSTKDMGSRAAAEDTSDAGYQPSASGYARPTGGYEPSGGYEPPTGGYVPYEPDAEAEPAQDDEAPNRTRKGVMDLDEDGDESIMKQAEELKRQRKAQRDREADETVRKAAEADAARDAELKGKKSGWLGGWFGGNAAKKEANAPVVHKGKLGEKLSLYYDPETKRWVNPNADPADAASSAAPTPPPPRAGPPLGVKPPPAPYPPSPAAGSPTTLLPPSGPPSRPSSAATMADGPPGAGVPLPGSAPPSRPPTSMSNASSIDDLLGGPLGPRKAGAAGAGKKGKKGSRYVDVMAK